MTSPTYSDETRSVQRYLSWAFPNKEIRRSRFGDKVDFDILITTVDGVIEDVGKAAILTNTNFIIYYDAASYDDAQDARERFLNIIEIGRDLVDHSLAGHRRRIPLWQWVGDEGPAPLDSAITGYLRINDVNSRVVEQEEPGRYVTILEFRSTSFRYTPDDDSPSLSNVNLSGGVNP